MFCLGDIFEITDMGQGTVERIVSDGKDRCCCLLRATSVFVPTECDIYVYVQGRSTKLKLPDSANKFEPIHVSGKKAAKKANAVDSSFAPPDIEILQSTFPHCKCASKKDLQEKEKKYEVEKFVDVQRHKGIVWWTVKWKNYKKLSEETDLVLRQDLTADAYKELVSEFKDHCKTTGKRLCDGV